MRIAYVTPGIGGGGGAERSLAALAPCLTEKIELHVIAFTPKDHLRGELVAAGAQVSRIDAGSSLEILSELRRHLTSIKPDLVHTVLIDADVLGRAAAMSCGIPVVSSLVNVNHGVHEFVGRPAMDAKTLAVWGANGATARSVVRFHALTNHVAETMSRRLLIPRSRIDVIPRGRSAQLVDIDRSSVRATTRKSLGVDDDTPLVVAAARHEKQKGLDVLIRASRQLCAQRPDAVVLIGGRDGNETPHLRRLIDQFRLGDNIRMIGQRDDVTQLMCAADVWCVPSRWEGLGGILLEAMAVGVPTVASAIPAIIEIAGSPPVFELVPPDDERALANATCQLLEAPQTMFDRIQIGKERFLGLYTSPAVAGQMIEFYRRAFDASRLTKVSGKRWI